MKELVNKLNRVKHFGSSPINKMRNGHLRNDTALYRAEENPI